jgi:hypothetical protein
MHPQFLKWAVGSGILPREGETKQCSIAGKEGFSVRRQVILSSVVLWSITTWIKAREYTWYKIN